MASSLILSHGLAIYAILAAPWLGCRWYRKARNRIASGVADAKVRMYREVVAEQIITALMVFAIWKSGDISAKNVGLVPPPFWALNAGGLAIVVALLFWSSLRMRPNAEKVRKQLEKSIGALLPRSESERFWFGVVSVGAGISEELVFRGFLFFYFSKYVPHLNISEILLLCTLFFGLAHAYQGWKGVLGTGFLGFVFGGLYLLTGSLVAPVVVHAAVDMRALLMFPPEEPVLPIPVGA